MGMAETESLTGQERKASKALGAFYTDAEIADFLVWWAVRSAGERVIDPSFGGGAFLRSACQRLTELGGEPARQVFGVEIDPKVHARMNEAFSESFGLTNGNLVLADFFAVDAVTVGLFDAVVGNPPFIRYHHFAGASRKAALRRAASQGVQLSSLTSSWAPFLIHSTSIIKRGGRLAMVVPMEIAYASYARPVLDYLSRRFARVTFLTFRGKLFPDLSEDTMLLLAEGKDEKPVGFFWKDFDHAGILEKVRHDGKQRLAGVTRLDATAIAQGTRRIMENFVPAKARALYQTMRRPGLTARLGDLADVGIGYVTGANAFFHLSHEDVNRWGIPDAFLRPAVRKGRSLSGLRFTKKDWHHAVRMGEAAFLLFIEAPETDLPPSLLAYLEHGKTLGVADAFKCRTRTPWFRVPHVYEPDAFLTYMSGVSSRLVANETKAVAPNSLHILRIHPMTSFTSHSLAALWQTSLTRLSAEIEGHALGGGMLKIEPTEAENVLVATNGLDNGQLASLARELDTLVRQGQETAARALADRAILVKGLGLTERECLLLRSAASQLCSRRYPRG